MCILTSGVGVRFGLVVLSSVAGHTSDDDNPVVAVDEGFVVGVGLRRVSADGGGGDVGTSASIDQGLHCGGILKLQNGLIRS